MESNGQDSLEDQIVDQVVANLKRVFDPELPLNIYDLGLIYAVKLNQNLIVLLI